MRLTINMSPEEFTAGGLAELGRRFDELHEQLFTFQLDTQHELYNLRTVVQGRESDAAATSIASGNGDPSAAAYEQSSIFYDGNDHPTQIFDRAKLRSGNLLRGPAIVTEMDSTSLILPGHTGEIDGHGNILIRPAG